MSAMNDAGQRLKIAVELPAEAADIDGRSVGELAYELRLLWTIDRVRSGRISLGKGAELAGMDRWSFMRAMSEHAVPVIGYSVEDLKKDVATLESL
jgi:predicted HTH domain antitoxin